MSKPIILFAYKEQSFTKCTFSDQEDHETITVIEVFQDIHALVKRCHNTCHFSSDATAKYPNHKIALPRSATRDQLLGKQVQIERARVSIILGPGQSVLDIDLKSFTQWIPGDFTIRLIRLLSLISTDLLYAEERFMSATDFNALQVETRAFIDQRLEEHDPAGAMVTITSENMDRILGGNR